MELIHNTHQFIFDTIPGSMAAYVPRTGADPDFSVCFTPQVSRENHFPKLYWKKAYCRMSILIHIMQKSYTWEYTFNFILHTDSRSTSDRQPCDGRLYCSDRCTRCNFRCFGYKYVDRVYYLVLVSKIINSLFLMIVVVGCLPMFC